MHLAARLPGVDDTTGAGPRSRSRIGFSSFEEVAGTAERGLFDFVLLAHESLAVLGALAAVTERLGLAAAVGTTFNEPYELARRLATLDHVSGGRVAWNVVPSSDAPAGENFRRGGFLDRADRYPRAAEFLETARELWDSWTADGVPRPFAHRGRHFDIAGEFTVPRSPQGHPVVIQAGDGDEGREFAASAADVVLTRQRPLEDGRAFYADVKRRLAAYGRAPDDLKIMLGVGVVLADTDAEARERAAGIRRGVDLPSRDDGLGAPLPGLDQVADPALAQGRPRRGGTVAVAGEPSLRQTLVEVGGPQAFVGTPEEVATELDAFVRCGAADGFLLDPRLTPGGLDEFVDKVVPLLQERGAFRTRYQGTTLRSHLGLPDPVGSG
ncbi:NtaA/DmoA family FMN-dependent monooxygenase [Streptomyces sp. SAI-126]|uniref:NtaA/DmoA family FMN-dependent monooxygenase n=1 Tax=Streptomyces sp. SAI-126 TaxID=3377732 RepID=UPI003C7C7B95